MNFQEEILRFTDELIFANTGKYLDGLQQSIVLAAWQGEKYAKIAEKFDCTEGHVKDVASELWKLLSKALGKNVNKSNFKAILERLRISIVSSNSVQIGNFNLCGDTLHYPKVGDQEKHSSPTENHTHLKNRQDLTDAPTLNNFYDRTSELTTLKQWILEDHTRLITIYGLSGIGKSAIALKLIE